MPGKVILDKSRFEEILKQKVKKNLDKFISSDDFVLPDKSGKGTIKIPIPKIDIPRFKFETRQQKGVGHGDGEEGDFIGEEQEGSGEGSGAGDQPGDDSVEVVEFSEEEFLQILGEALSLPFREPKGEKSTEKKYSIKGVRRTGPEALRHGKRTYKQALKRQIASGEYNPKNPVIVPVKDDKRYRSFKVEEIPSMNAVIIHATDVSGSIGDEDRLMERRISYCIDKWIGQSYEEVDQRYLIHDIEAEEVDEEKFFTKSSGGGTLISSVFELFIEIIEKDYPIEDWNIYIFYYSDGDNWNNKDNIYCGKLLDEKILPAVNLFCYGHLNTGGWSSRTSFLKFMERREKKTRKVRISNIRNRGDILLTVKKFLSDKD